MVNDLFNVLQAKIIALIELQIYNNINKMLANVQYSVRNQNNKNPLVFPPLVGGKRRVDVENAMRVRFDCRQKQQLQQESEVDFLNRMKKAKQLILNHQRQHRIQIQQANPKKLRSKTEQIYENNIPLSSRDLPKIYSNFSQVIYNINEAGSNSNRIKTKKSVGNQLFNDKLLRQCKSQFMSKQKSDLSKKIVYGIKKSKFLQSDNKNEQQNYYSNKTFSKILPKPHYKKIFVSDSAQQFLMKLNLQQDIINESGSALVQKLKKCQQKCLNRNQIKNEQQRSINLSSQVNFQTKQQLTMKKQIKNFSFRQKQKVSKTKLQLLYQKKQRSNIKKIKISFQKAKQILSQNSEDQADLMQPKYLKAGKSQEKNSENKQQTQSKVHNFKNFKNFRIKTNPQKSQDIRNQNNQNPQNEIELRNTQEKVQKRQPIKSEETIKMKQDKKLPRMPETNYRIQGWNLKQTLQFQLF